MEPVAVIDIGTNSLRLFIGEVRGNSIITLFKDIKITRLGEGISKTNELGSTSINRTIIALKQFQNYLTGYHVKEVRCFATSAVRDAHNRDSFINKVKDEVGFAVTVLSGKQEAHLEFAGGTFDWSEQSIPLLLLDIGGGSTELMLGREGRVFYAKSFDMGAVRLKDMFCLPYCPSKEDWNGVDRYISYILQKDWHPPHYKSNMIVGTGGTITSCAAVLQGLEVYDPSKIHGYVLSIDDIKSMFYRLCSLGPEAKEVIPGLQPERADIILYGIYILIKIMLFLDMGKITVSDNDILEGMLLATKKI